LSFSSLILSGFTYNVHNSFYLIHVTTEQMSAAALSNKTRSTWILQDGKLVSSYYPDCDLWWHLSVAETNTWL